MIREGRAQQYLDEFVLGLDHFEYLEKIGGLRKLTQLRRMLAS